MVAKSDRVELAIRAYLRGEASLGGGAEIAKMSYCDFREIVRVRGLLSARSVGLTKQ